MTCNLEKMSALSFVRAQPGLLSGRLLESGCRLGASARPGTMLDTCNPGKLLTNFGESVNLGEGSTADIRLFFPRHIKATRLSSRTAGPPEICSRLKN